MVPSLFRVLEHDGDHMSRFSFARRLLISPLRFGGRIAFIQLLQNRTRILTKVERDQRNDHGADSTDAADFANAKSASVFDVATLVATLPAQWNSPTSRDRFRYQRSE